MTLPPETNLAAARREYYARLQDQALAPLWEVLSALVPPSPRTSAVAARWRYDKIRPFIAEAGELITAQEAERRVLILENPALPGQARITSTLYAGLQLILPGEVAPAHRHTQSALRFVLEGEGAFTALNGERAPMHRHDLVLTPNWVWHDHGNETEQPMVWLDGLDIPLISAFDAGFAEHRPDRGGVPTSRPPGDSLHRWGASMRPARLEAEPISNPLFIYPHRQWRTALARIAAADSPNAHDGHKMEFANPVDGGSVLTTISAFAQLVPTGYKTRPLRSSDGIVLVVTEGDGRLFVEEESFDLHPGDICVVPSWKQRRIEAGEDLVLFSYSDKAAQQKLNLWREELL